MGRSLKLLDEDRTMEIQGNTGVRDELDIQRDCHDILLPQLQRRGPTWKVLLRIMNIISPPKATKASAISAEEFT
jgi:hypothetical protein